MKLHRKFGRSQIEMIETIESNQLPEKIICIFEAPVAWNRVVYRFNELSPNETE
jgi:hypothetical protein